MTQCLLSFWAVLFERVLQMVREVFFTQLVVVPKNTLQIGQIRLIEISPGPVSYTHLPDAPLIVMRL